MVSSVFQWYDIWRKFEINETKRVIPKVLWFDEERGGGH